MGKKTADSFGALVSMTVGKRAYEIFLLDALEKRGWERSPACPCPSRYSWKT